MQNNDSPQWNDGQYDDALNIIIILTMFMLLAIFWTLKQEINESFDLLKCIGKSPSTGLGMRGCFP